MGALEVRNFLVSLESHPLFRKGIVGGWPTDLQPEATFKSVWGVLGPFSLSMSWLIGASHTEAEVFDTLSSRAHKLVERAGPYGKELGEIIRACQHLHQPPLPDATAIEMLWKRARDLSDRAFWRDGHLKAHASLQISVALIDLLRPEPNTDSGKIWRLAFTVDGFVRLFAGVVEDQPTVLLRAWFDFQAVERGIAARMREGIDGKAYKAT